MCNRFKKIVNFMVLTVFILSQSGCLPLMVGAAAGVGGYVWVRGAIEQNFDASAEKVHDATVKALKSLKLTISDDTYDRLKAKVVGEFADGEKVTIDINALTELTSKIKIRVGIFYYSFYSKF